MIRLKTVGIGPVTQHAAKRNARWRAVIEKKLCRCDSCCAADPMRAAARDKDRREMQRRMNVAVAG